MSKARFVSVDPGKHACSVAFWSEGAQLQGAAMVKSDTDARDGLTRPEIWRHTGITVANYLWNRVSGSIGLVLEVPQIYERAQAEDKNDLIDLAGVLGALVAALGPTAEVEWAPHPAEWKGQLKKEITKQRVDAKLTDQEKARITWPSAKSLHHNVYDAIHMGIVFLEREGLRVFTK